MSVHSVLGAEDITGTALSDLATILRVMDDKKGLKEKLLLVAEETAKLAAERAAVGSLQQIESLKAEALHNKEESDRRLDVATDRAKAAVDAADSQADRIIKEAEAKANKNAVWAAELLNKQHELEGDEASVANEHADVLRRETKADEAQDKADDLMREAEELKRKFQDKLDAMAKLQAA